MRSTRTTLAMTAAVCALLLLTTNAAAQEGMPEMTPEEQAQMEAYMKAGAIGPEHEEMAEAVGTYDVEVTSWMSPDAPPMESSGTATRTLTLDGRVMVEEFEGSMMGTPFTGIGRHGFDNVTGKYWSTWTDSMSTGIMISEGTCDDEGVCTYTGSWNDPITKGPVTARMTMRPLGEGKEEFVMFGPGPDGDEMKMMRLVYTKRK